MRCWWFVFRKQYYSTTSVESCECVLTWNNNFKSNSKLDFKCYVEIAKNDNHIKILSWKTFAKSQTKCTKSWQRPTNNTIRLSICGWIQKKKSLFVTSIGFVLYCLVSTIIVDDAKVHVWSQSCIYIQYISCVDNINRDESTHM